ncbi:MAG TPA: ribosome silencing factor [Candidatus Eremiobacteraceae bacterium]|nr:ribosome silencing factor [Candidatus Eremiobacteraceae bacterium]
MAVKRKRGPRRPVPVRTLANAVARARALAPRRDGIASTSTPIRALSESQARDLAHACRDAALEKKAENVLLLDIRDRAAFADYFVVATGRSVIQARSIADAVVEANEKRSGAPLRTEGYSEGSWILVDYGPVIVHVFTPQAREFYDLERLWSKPAPAKKR